MASFGAFLIPLPPRHLRLFDSLAKISEILPDTIEVPLDALTGCLSVLPRVQTTYDPEIFRVLVSAVRQSGQCFCRPAGFRAKDYMAESFGTIRGDGDFHVVLRFTRAYAGRIAEKQWHASQVVEPQPDGTLIPAHNIDSILPVTRSSNPSPTAR